jgi:hypothetical protein
MYLNVSNPRRCLGLETIALSGRLNHMVLLPIQWNIKTIKTFLCIQELKIPNDKKMKN